MPRPKSHLPPYRRNDKRDCEFRPTLCQRLLMGTRFWFRQLSVSPKSFDRIAIWEITIW
jgi:hypothetical protein